MKIYIENVKISEPIKELIGKSFKYSEENKRSILEFIEKNKDLEQEIGNEKIDKYIRKLLINSSKVFRNINGETNYLYKYIISKNKNKILKELFKDIFFIDTGKIYSINIKTCDNKEEEYKTKNLINNFKKSIDDIINNIGKEKIIKLTENNPEADILVDLIAMNKFDKAANLSIKIKKIESELENLDKYYHNNKEESKKELENKLEQLKNEYYKENNKIKVLTDARTYYEIIDSFNSKFKNLRNLNFGAKQKNYFVLLYPTENNKLSEEFKEQYKEVANVFYKYKSNIKHIKDLYEKLKNNSNIMKLEEMNYLIGLAYMKKAKLLNTLDEEDKKYLKEAINEINKLLKKSNFNINNILVIKSERNNPELLFKELLKLSQIILKDKEENYDISLILNGPSRVGKDTILKYVEKLINDEEISKLLKEDKQNISRIAKKLKNILKNININNNEIEYQPKDKIEESILKSFVNTELIKAKISNINSQERKLVENKKINQLKL